MLGMRLAAVVCTVWLTTFSSFVTSAHQTCQSANCTVLEGDLYFNESSYVAADWSWLAAVQEIRGTVLWQSSSFPPLPSLLNITGDLLISNNLYAHTARLPPNLVWIGGDFAVFQNDNLGVLVGNSHLRVGRSLLVHNNPQLASLGSLVGLPSAVAGNVSICGNPALCVALASSDTVRITGNAPLMDSGTASSAVACSLATLSTIQQYMAASTTSASASDDLCLALSNTVQPLVNLARPSPRLWMSASDPLVASHTISGTFDTLSWCAVDVSLATTATRQLGLFIGTAQLSTIPVLVAPAAVRLVTRLVRLRQNTRQDKLVCSTPFLSGTAFSAANSTCDAVLSHTGLFATPNLTAALSQAQAHAYINASTALLGNSVAETVLPSLVVLGGFGASVFADDATSYAQGADIISALYARQVTAAVQASLGNADSISNLLERGTQDVPPYLPVPLVDSPIAVFTMNAMQPLVPSPPVTVVLQHGLSAPTVTNTSTTLLSRVCMTRPLNDTTVRWQLGTCLTLPSPSTTTTTTSCVCPAGLTANTAVAVVVTYTTPTPPFSVYSLFHTPATLRAFAILFYGSIANMVFFALVFLTYAFLWRLRTRPMSYIMDLCIALIGVNGYLLWGFEGSFDTLRCTTSCLLGYYFVMVVLGRLAHIAIVFYRGIVSLEADHSSKPMWRIMMPLWLIVLVPTALLAILNATVSGGIGLGSAYVCFLSRTLVQRIGFILPAGLLLSFSVLCFSFTLFSLSRHRKIATGKTVSLRQHVLIILALALVLSVTWIAACVLISTLNYVVFSIFVCFNATQGIGIFLIYVARARVLQELRCSLFNHPRNTTTTSTSESLSVARSRRAAARDVRVRDSVSLDSPPPIAASAAHNNNNTTTTTTTVTFTPKISPNLDDSGGFSDQDLASAVSPDSSVVVAHLPDFMATPAVADGFSAADMELQPLSMSADHSDSDDDLLATSPPPRSVPLRKAYFQNSLPELSSERNTTMVKVPERRSQPQKLDHQQQHELQELVEQQQHRHNQSLRKIVDVTGFSSPVYSHGASAITTTPISSSTLRRRLRGVSASALPTALGELTRRVSRALGRTIQSATSFALPSASARAAIYHNAEQMDALNEDSDSDSDPDQTTV